MWYSVGWTASALNEFHEAVNSMLKHNPTMEKHTAAARVWLEEWQHQTVPLEQACNAWADRCQGCIGWIANLLPKEDRMVGCACFLSGDLQQPIGAGASSAKSGDRMCLQGQSSCLGSHQPQYIQGGLEMDENFSPWRRKRLCRSSYRCDFTLTSVIPCLGVVGNFPEKQCI